jgi:hypothetical protein
LNYNLRRYIGVAGGLTIAGMKDYECTPGDMYGKEPTVIKIALSILIDVGPKFAFMMVIRNFHISRLIFMCLSMPPSSMLKAMAPVIDIFSAKKFDVSLNSSPFPVGAVGRKDIARHVINTHFNPRFLSGSAIL